MLIILAPVDASCETRLLISRLLTQKTICEAASERIVICFSAQWQQGTTGNLDPLHGDRRDSFLRAIISVREILVLDFWTVFPSFSSSGVHNSLSKLYVQDFLQILRDPMAKDQLDLTHGLRLLTRLTRKSRCFWLTDAQAPLRV